MQLDRVLDAEMQQARECPQACCISSVNKCIENIAIFWIPNPFK